MEHETCTTVKLCQIVYENYWPEIFFIIIFLLRFGMKFILTSKKENELCNVSVFFSEGIWKSDGTIPFFKCLLDLAGDAT